MSQPPRNSSRTVSPSRWPFIVGVAAAPLLLIVDLLVPAAKPIPMIAIAVVLLALALYGARTARLAVLTEPAPGAMTPQSERPVARARGEPGVAELKRELERHRELERQLIRAKQEAEAATMAKSEFLATMSHEIRTPLNGIIPLLDILHSTRLEPDQRDYVLTAYQSARQLLSIVDDILDYSKIEARKLELESVGINLKEIADSITRLLGKTAESKALRLTVTIDPNVRLAMRGDPTRLRQVLSNLVSNAIKFTERGNIEISVKKRGETRTHSDVLFSVTDSGAGMTSEVQERLFKPFTQADASTTRVHGGTGLGLVICKRIVELMGGEIGVRSEPGRGSMFWFSVPLQKAVGDVAPARTDLHGSRALLATADTGVTKRTGSFLQSFGVQFVHTSVAADALAKLRTAANMGDSWAYDFLVVELGTMKTSALSLMRNVLRDGALESVHIVVIGDDEAPPELRTLPRVGVFGREVRDIDLRTGMQRLLDTPLGGDEAAAPVDALLPELKAAEALTPTLQQQPAMFAPRADSPMPTPIAPAATAAVPGVGGHVLLVEDNAVNRQVAQRLLALCGVSYDVAENGRQAVERVATARYDAVLMDCMMPILDGYGATRALRKLEQEGKSAGHLPIIAMTANAMAGDREKCLAAGMDDYMSKPLNRALLEQTLRRWLPGTLRADTSAAAVARTVVPPAPGTRPVTAAATVAATGTVPAARSGVPTMVSPARIVMAPVMPRPGLKPEPVASEARAAIDQEIIQDLLEMMGSEFTELVRVYLEDTPKSIGQLANAARHRDVEGLIGPAHSLKSTSANLGALALSELAKRIEHGARQAALPGEPAALVAELAAEYQRVGNELKRLLATVAT